MPDQNPHGCCLCQRAHLGDPLPVACNCPCHSRPAQKAADWKGARDDQDAAARAAAGFDQGRGEAPR